MSANTRWGRAGWGRTPASLRRQAPPMFMHRDDDVAAVATYGEIRFLSSHVDSDLSSQSEVEGWIESLLDMAEES